MRDESPTAAKGQLSKPKKTPKKGLNTSKYAPDEHIEKIVSTYQFREPEDRYARRVSMEEIEKNGFNLNISRYISTATAEEAIDLQAVNATLVDLQQQIARATQTHNQFLQELGLPLLPME